jgi:hypothetical protein
MRHSYCHIYFTILVGLGKKTHIFISRLSVFKANYSFADDDFVSGSSPAGFFSILERCQVHVCLGAFL